MPNPTRDYGDTTYNRRPTVGAVLHERAMRAIYKLDDIPVQDVLDHFNMTMPAVGTAMEFQVWLRRLTKLKIRYAREVLGMDLAPLSGYVHY